jgi:hypothetical protein
MRRISLLVSSLVATFCFTALSSVNGQTPTPTPTPSPVLFALTLVQNQLGTISTTDGQGTVVQTSDDNLSGYGLAAYQGGLYTFNPNRSEIDQLSPIDGHVIARTAFSVTGLKGEGDLAIQPTTGVGYLASALDQNGNPTHPFYTFNVQTGVALMVGNTSVAIDGLAFDQSMIPVLYAVGQGDDGDSDANDPTQGNAMLYTVNQLTGALTAVGPLGVPQNSPVAGITFGANGTLYGAIDDQLYTINTTSGAATLVNAASPYVGFSSISGLAFTQGVSDLANISTRANVGTGNNVAIAGFMVRSQASASPSPQPTPSPEPSASPTASPSPSPTPSAGNKTIIIRALGPSLQANGKALTGTLADPTLTLYDINGVQLAYNDNYQDNSTADQSTIASAGLTPSKASESVIIATVPAGQYTAMVSGKNNTTGIALIEAYDVTAGNGEKLVNISTRSQVSGGDSVSISGTIIEGSQQKRVLFRGIGPSLQGQVPNALADPMLQLFDANGNSVASNDNWMQQDAATVSDIQSSGLAPSNAKESVVDVTLQPGAYTAVLSGVGGASGIGLVEMYDRD